MDHALDWTLNAPELERSLEWTLRAPGLELSGLRSGPCMQNSQKVKGKDGLLDYGNSSEIGLCCVAISETTGVGSSRTTGLGTTGVESSRTTELGTTRAYFAAFLLLDLCLRVRRVKPRYHLEVWSVYNKLIKSYQKNIYFLLRFPFEINAVVLNFLFMNDFWTKK